MKYCLAFLLLLTSFSSLAAAQIVPTRVRVSAGVASGILLTKVDPVYPPLARQARIQGTVIMKVLISKTGDVVNIDLMSGHPMLAPAAVAAVKQWKYKPYLLNGNPVEVDTQVQVNFALSNQPAGEGIAQSVPGAPPDAATPPPQDATGAQHIHVSSGVAQGLLIKKVAPEYPPEARQQQIQGTVLLQVTIDTDGNVAAANLTSGHPLLVRAALDAIKQWKYRPYVLNGTPVIMETQAQVIFTLAP